MLLGTLSIIVGFPDQYLEPTSLLKGADRKPLFSASSKRKPPYVLKPKGPDLGAAGDPASAGFLPCAQLGLAYSPTQGCAESSVVSAFGQVPDCTDELLAAQMACAKEVTDSLAATLYSTKVSSTKETNDLTSTVSGAEGGGFGVTASTSVSTMQSSTMTSTSITFILGAGGTKRQKVVQFPQNLELNPSVASAIANENLGVNDIQWPSKYFVQTIGYGGTFFGYYSYDTTSAESSSEMDVMAEMTYSKFFTASTEVSTARQSLSSNVKETFQVSCTGSDRCLEVQSWDGGASDGPDKLNEAFGYWLEDYGIKGGDATSVSLMPIHLSNTWNKALSDRIAVEAEKEAKGQPNSKSDWIGKQNYYSGQGVSGSFYGLVVDEYTNSYLLQGSLKVGKDEQAYTSDQRATMRDMFDENMRHLTYMETMPESNLEVHQQSYLEGDNKACADGICLFMFRDMNPKYMEIYNTIDPYSPPPPSPPPPCNTNYGEGIFCCGFSKTDPTSMDHSTCPKAMPYCVGYSGGSDPDGECHAGTGAWSYLSMGNYYCSYENQVGRYNGLGSDATCQHRCDNIATCQYAQFDFQGSDKGECHLLETCKTRFAYENRHLWKKDKPI